MFADWPVTVKKVLFHQESILLVVVQADVNFCQLTKDKTKTERWNEREAQKVYTTTHWKTTHRKLKQIAKMDSWAIGCILYELITGKICFPIEHNITALKWD